MSEKPREFWIHVDDGKSFDGAVFHVVEIATTNVWDRGQITHVIEYSAYEDLQAKLETAREALTKSLDHLEVFNFAKDPVRVAHADTIIRQALKEIGK